MKVIKNNKNDYLVSLDDVLKNNLIRTSEDQYYFVSHGPNFLIIEGKKVINFSSFFENIISKMELTDSSKYFLNNAQRGVSFCGIGDLWTGKIHLHPLKKNKITRSIFVHTDNENQLKDFDDNSFPKDALVFYLIEHEMGGHRTSHAQLANMIINSNKYSNCNFEFINSMPDFIQELIYNNNDNLPSRDSIIKKEDARFAFRFFGFSVFVNTPNSKNEYFLLEKANRKKSDMIQFPVRGRSQTNNGTNFWPEAIHSNGLKSLFGKKYFKVSFPYEDSKKIIKNILRLNTNSRGTLPVKIIKALAKTISSQITNKELIKSMSVIKKTDIDK